jgi:mannan endo-1,4-beta-mannosidase
MNEKSRVNLKIMAIIMASVVLVASLILVYSTFRNQDISLTKIEPDLDAAVNNCFKEIRKDTESNFVFLETFDANRNKLINKYDGYEISVPNDWKLDNTNLECVTNLYNNNFKLSIFKQEVDLTYDTTQNYISYSNYHIRHNYGTTVLLTDEAKSIGPFSAQTVSWKRDEISAIDNDLDYYRESNIVLDDKTVLTFLLKSNQSMIENYIRIVDEIISNMLFINQTTYPTAAGIVKDIPDIELKGKTLSLTIPNDKCLFGIFHLTHNDYLQELTNLEKDIDHKFELLMDYYSFSTPFKQAKEKILTLYHDERIMMVTLQPFLSSDFKNFNGSCLIPKIANGEYDEFLFEWAKGLKDLGEPVFLRFGNEMNGDWAEWCSWFYSLDPDLYIMAWSRIYALFERVGANNVYFVWNPHDRTYPDYRWNKEYLYYPGDSKVNWIGLTAYNNGVTRPNEKWREFEECYSKLYLEYMPRYSSKPFMIAEFACNEIGGNKSQWITQGFSLLRENYPNIRMAVWWNGIDDTWIYDIDSTQQSKEAFKEALKDPYFQLNAVDPI